MQTAKKIWGIVSMTLVVLTVVCAVFLTGSRLLGYQVYTVITGSMEPELNVGDLIYVKSVKNIHDIRVGDDLTFVLNEDLVVATHRVVRIDAEKQHIYTKGIANEIEDDAPVHFKNVIGTVSFSLPLLGYVANFIQNPPGMYISIAAGVLLIALVFLPDFLSKKKVKPEEAPEDTSVQDENARLQQQVEELKAQLQKQQDQPSQTQEQPVQEQTPEGE